MYPGKRLREILAQPGIYMAPGVYDCIGACLAEQAGFDLVFSSGFGLAASLLGKPDFGYLTATEMIAAAGRIAACVSIPLIADMDTGYGNPLNVIRTVSEVVRLGVAGVILEDQEWPKKCGHFDGKRVIPAEDHAEKIKAAVYARKESDLVIVARTDARAVFGLDEAINRAGKYLEAGADVIFVEAPQSVEELKSVAAAFPGVPLFANIVEGGKTPILNAEELEALGYKLVAFPLSGLFSVTRALQDCFNSLKQRRGITDSEGKPDFKEFEKIIGVKEHRALEARFRSESG